MKILVVGNKGQLGWELTRQAPEMGLVAEGVDLPDFDITDKIAVAAQIGKTGPDVVVNASGYTAVDQAEQVLVNRRRSRWAQELCVIIVQRSPLSVRCSR